MPITNPELIAEILEMVQEDLDEMVHDLKGKEAAAINNDGPVSQVAYLLDLNYEDVLLVVQQAREKGARLGAELDGIA